MCRRLSRHAGDVFFVDADTHPQTIAVLRTRAEPIGIELVVGDLDADLDPAAAFGVLVSQPGSSGRLRSVATLDGADRRGARRRRARGGGRRPAVARCCSPPPGDVGRRHRRRLGAALRRADGLRRAPRRLPRDPRRLRPVAARPPGRRVHRHRRTPRPAPRPADARAAHPPGEGHVEHLHGPGAPGQHRRPLRRVARPRRAGPHRRAGAPPHVDPRRRPAGAAASRSSTTRGSTPSPCASRAGPPTSLAAAPASAASSCARSTPTPSASASTRPPPAPSSPTLWAVFGVAATDRGARRRRPRRHPGRLCAARTRSSPTPSSTATAASTRCCATCAGWPTATSPSTAR